MKNLSLLIFFFLLFCLIPLKSLAANLDVVINEIAWMGTQVSPNDEWMELYNNTDIEISLDGWGLYEEGGKTLIKPLTGIIGAKSYYLIERTNDDTVPNIEASQPPTSWGGHGLNNNGEHLQLLDSNLNIIDEVNYSSGWLFGDNITKQTMERTPTGWQTSENSGGTPKTQNSAGIAPQNSLPLVAEQVAPTPTLQSSPEVGPPPIYPDGIIFNEILPSPEGADDQNEWIEIYNQNNFEVDLTGWKIQDTEGKVTIYTIPNNTKIKSKNYLVLPRPLTKITLNNTSDGLKLSQPNNKVIDSATFQKAPIGQSYNRTDSGWMWSSTLTPGAANIIFSVQTITKTGPKQNQDSQIDKTNYSAGLAGIYSSLSQNLPGAKDPWFLFLIAIIITIVSGLIVIFVKRKMRKNP